MNIENILNQVLQTGKKILDNRDSSPNQPSNSGFDINRDALKKLGGGAAAVGLLSMLMGNKSRGIGINSSMRKMGSLAAIGTLAYKAYQSWQDKQPSQSTTTNAQPTYERNEQSRENNSRIIVKAMIAAASADGHIDNQEKQIILEEIGSEDAQTRQWIEQQLQHPANPAQLAQEIGNDTALAAEVYLASRIISDDLHRKEIVYLHQLAQALNLDKSLVEHLEKQAGF